MDYLHWTLALVYFFALTQSGLMTEAKVAKNKTSISTRIVGGHDAVDGQAPFYCSLQLWSVHYCGCAIISNEFVVTAAHCLEQGSRTKKIKISVGTNNWRSDDAVLYSLKDFIIHKDYDNPEYANDIGLIHLQTPIEFNEKVQPIKYSTMQVPNHAELQILGYGQWATDSRLSENLQVLNVRLISHEECNDKKYRLAVTTHKSHMCTLNKADEGMCTGDSGGPLVWKNELVGVANWVTRCGAGLPEGYAKISYFFDWIQQNINSQ